MLGEAALTARRRRALLASLRRRDRRARRARADGTADVLDAPGDLGQAVGAASALRSRQARARASPNWRRSCWRSPQLAKAHGIGLTVDAEEADRLELSLDIIGAVLADPSLAGWNGFGLAVQAYQKRAPFVHRLARRHSRARHGRR